MSDSFPFENFSDNELRALGGATRRRRGSPGSGLIRLRGTAIPLLQHASSGGVHEIIAHDVVLSRDPRVGVPE